MKLGFEQVFPLAGLLLVAGCGAADSDIDEAAAYLSVNDETADPESGLHDAVAGRGDQDLESFAEEASSDAPDPEEASAIGVCDFEAHRARIIANYDTDEDGALSRAERRQLREDLDAMAADRPRLRRLVRHVRNQAWHALQWVFDENGDRRLDDEERAVLIETFEARCEAKRARVLAEFDANDDGTLDATELEALRADRRARLAEAKQRVLAEFDANSDGQLDLVERAAWKRAVIEGLRARGAELRARFDVDGDGVLGADELLALKAALREAIAAGEPIRPLR